MPSGFRNVQPRGLNDLRNRSAFASGEPASKGIGREQYLRPKGTTSKQLRQSGNFAINLELRRTLASSHLETWSASSLAVTFFVLQKIEPPNSTVKAANAVGRNLHRTAGDPI